MAEGRRPVGSLMATRKADKERVQIGTIWPGNKEGNFSISFGSRAYKERPEINAKQAATIVSKADEYFFDIWMNDVAPAKPAKKQQEDDFSDEILPF